MSANPTFFGTVNTGVAQAPATNDTSLTAPTHVTTLFTAGTNGSIVNEIDYLGLGTTANGRLNVFLVRSATYYLVYQFIVTGQTPSATQIVSVGNWLPQNLVLKNGDTLAISVMETGNESLIQVNAFGADA
jgi:hypothetical protein